MARHFIGMKPIEPGTPEDEVEIVLKSQIYAIQNHLSFIITGNHTDIINPGDEVVTPLMTYRVNYVDYFKKDDLTCLSVKEIVL